MAASLLLRQGRARALKVKRCRAGGREPVERRGEPAALTVTPAVPGRPDLASLAEERALGAGNGGRARGVAWVIGAPGVLSRPRTGVGLQRSRPISVRTVEDSVLLLI